MSRRGRFPADAPRGPRGGANGNWPRASIQHVPTQLRGFGFGDSMNLGRSQYQQYDHQYQYQERPNAQLSVPAANAWFPPPPLPPTASIESRFWERYTRPSYGSHTTNAASTAAETRPLASSEFSQMNQVRQSNKNQAAEISQAPTFEPRYFSQMGPVAFSGEHDCRNCQIETNSIRTSQVQISRMLAKHGPVLDEHYLSQCEELLKKKILLDDECEKCATIRNEKLQASQIERYTRICFHKDGTSHAFSMANLDKYYYLGYGLIQGAPNHLLAARQTITRLENEVSSLQAENTSLAERLRSKDEDISISEHRAIQVQNADNKIKAYEQSLRNAQDETRQLRAKFAEETESLIVALNTVEARAENAERDIIKMIAHFAKPII